MPLLHWSPRSPYVRRVMIAFREKGLAEQVALVRTHADPMQPHDGLMTVNPLSKIPTLELDDGTVLFDSHVICRWADASSMTGPRLFPDSAPGLVAERDAALGIGLLDVALAWLIEARLRPADQRSDHLTGVYRRKMHSAADWLAAQVPHLDARPFDIGHLTIVTALNYLDFRFGDEGWRDGRTALADWHARTAARPSVQAEPFRDDPRPA